MTQNNNPWNNQHPPHGQQQPGPGPQHWGQQGQPHWGGPPGSVPPHSGPPNPQYRYQPQGTNLGTQPRNSGKLFIIIALIVVVVVAGSAAAFFLLQRGSEPKVSAGQLLAALPTNCGTGDLGGLLEQAEDYSLPGYVQTQITETITDGIGCDSSDRIYLVGTTVESATELTNGIAEVLPVYAYGDTFQMASDRTTLDNGAEGAVLSYHWDGGSEADYYVLAARYGNIMFIDFVNAVDSPGVPGIDAHINHLVTLVDKAATLSAEEAAQSVAEPEPESEVSTSISSDPGVPVTSCTYMSDGSAARPVEMPLSDGVPAEGIVHVTLHLGVGDVTITMDRERTPCTVNSLVSLAEQGFYDDTACHRLVDQGIFILQCGDPTATGTGGPGYVMDEELIHTADYPAGTVAMAKRQEPSTSGSQFFLVWEDSPLPPEYTVFGTLDAASLEVVRGIGLQGVGADGMSPAADVHINKVTIN